MARTIATRRNTELLLLCAGAIPVVLLYAMYVANTQTPLSFHTLAVPLGLFAAFAVAHVAIRFLAPARTRSSCPSPSYSLASASPSSPASRRTTPSAK